MHESSSRLGLVNEGKTVVSFQRFCGFVQLYTYRSSRGLGSKLCRLEPRNSLAHLGRIGELPIQGPVSNSYDLHGTSFGISVESGSCRFRVQCPCLGVQGSGFRVQGSGFGFAGKHWICNSRPGSGIQGFRDGISPVERACTVTRRTRDTSLSSST
jgi:hypothetical protein